MSEEQNNPSNNLQFDRAEFQQPEAASFKCALCGRELQSYYMINGNAACEKCRYDVEAQLNEGTGSGRFVKAGLFGLGAAIAGAVVYFAVLKLTGYEFGLIAILVGYLVGIAVKKGSGARGGWPYQTLAMTLTYCAIVATYVPYIIGGLNEQAEVQTESPAATPSTQDQPAQPSAAVSGEAEPVSLTGNLPLMALIIGIAFIGPFLGGFQNIIGIIIIAIGLYEAWKLNRKTRIEITGPFSPVSPHAASS